MRAEEEGGDGRDQENALMQQISPMAGSQQIVSRRGVKILWVFYDEFPNPRQTRKCSTLRYLWIIQLRKFSLVPSLFLKQRLRFSFFHLCLFRGEKTKGLHGSQSVSQSVNLPNNPTEETPNNSFSDSRLSHCYEMRKNPFFSNLINNALGNAGGKG